MKRIANNLKTKKAISATLMVLGFVLTSQGQPARYFEFRATCSHGNWQDTSFIAIATDQVLIDTVLANLAKPVNQRKFIKGPIDHGNGGHNHNAAHTFLWHFVPDQWDLVEVAMEICDGCPYSDLDADTATWIGTVGQFCPWTGIPVREVSGPSGTGSHFMGDEILFYPNPATDRLMLKSNGPEIIFVDILTLSGVECAHHLHREGTSSIDIAHLPSGLYFLKVRANGKIVTKKLMIESDR